MQLAVCELQARLDKAVVGYCDKEPHLVELVSRPQERVDLCSCLALWRDFAEKGSCIIFYEKRLVESSSP